MIPSLRRKAEAAGSEAAAKGGRKLRAARRLAAFGALGAVGYGLATNEDAMRQAKELRTQATDTAKTAWQLGRTLATHILDVLRTRSDEVASSAKKAADEIKS